MVAPDLETLLDYATQFRAAGKSVLDARLASKPALSSAKVYADLAPDNKISPRCEIHFTQGAPTGHRRPAQNGRDSRYRYYNAFNGRLIFVVWTNRDTAPARMHDQLCSLVRATLLDFPSYFTVATLPYYLLDKAKPAAETLSTNQEKTMDVTQMPFDLHYAIYADAWPTGY